MYVQVVKLSWKMLANRLDDFPVAQEALSVDREMTTLALETAEGGTFETAIICLVHVISLPLSTITWKSLACAGGSLHTV